VVVEENENRLIELNVPRDKVVVVSNTPDVNELRKLSISFTGKGRKTAISYVGGISYLRGLDTLIKALPLIIRKNPETHLLLVGDGEGEVTELVKMSEQLGIEKHVTFTGWVSFDRAMFYKKPVIVSDVKPLKRIVSETGCGLVFRAGKHEELAEKLLELINDASKREEMGENGRRAVETRYNWDNEQKRLLLVYEKLFSD
jgi:glycosyltransferase involved in cell wall biosynthesis